MTYTLTGSYVHGDGSARVGRLKFEPSAAITDGATVVLPSPVSIALDSAGAFTVALVGTDDGDYSPSGWVWTVTEALDGGRTWSFELTADADIGDLSVAAVPPDYTVYVSIGDELTASVTSGAATVDQVPAADGSGGIAWADQSGSADHGTLTGLSDDDHSLYPVMTSQASEPAAPTGDRPTLWWDTDADADTVAALGDLSDVSTAGATSGQALVSDGTNWAPGDVGGGESLPVGGIVRIEPWDVPSATYGTWSLSTGSSYVGNAVFFTSVGGDGSYAEWVRYLSAGTYTLDCFYAKNGDAAIVETRIDGSLVNSTDHYAATLAANTRLTVTGIVVGASGIVTLRIVSNGKNASSSAYAIRVAMITLTRTA